MQENLFIPSKFYVDDECVIYSEGDIYHLSPIMATLYAIISKVNTFEFKIEDKIKYPEDEKRIGQRFSSRLSKIVKKSGKVK